MIVRSISKAGLSNKVADKISRFENNEFVTGAANKIRGFARLHANLGYRLRRDLGQIGYHVHRRVGGLRRTTPVDNLIDIMGLLKNAYLPNAKWFTRRSVITKIRKFKDSTGQSIWMPTFNAGFSEQIIGYPIVRMEDISALAANSYSLAFGDLAQAYQIVDRSGIRVLRDPFTSKPLHQVLHHQAHRRRHGELRSHQAHEVLLIALGD
jgi:HK97 family phage major capsid protein